MNKRLFLYGISRFLKFRPFFLSVLVLLLCVNGLLEMCGIAAAIPLSLSFFSNDFSSTGRFMDFLVSIFGISKIQSFQSLALILIILLGLSNALLLFVNWLSARLAWGFAQNISVELFQLYFKQPWEDCLLKDTNEVNRRVTVEAQRLAAGMVVPFLTIVSRGVLLLAIFGFLFYRMPLRTSIFLGLVMACSAVLYIQVQKIMHKLGTRSLSERERQSKIGSDALAGAKELKIYSRAEYVVDAFQNPTLLMVKIESLFQVLSSLPRFILEIVAFALVFLSMRNLSISSDLAQSSLPLVTMAVLSGYRLLPCLVQIYSNGLAVQYNAPALNTLMNDLLHYQSHATSPASGQVIPYQLRDAIHMENVSYSYPQAPKPVLASVSIKIAKGDMIGIIGKTGAGKSTFIDVLLGFLDPSSGKILVDGVPLKKIGPAWQECIGYVPQSIFLADDTIFSNITFGLPHHLTNEEWVQESAKKALLHDFILSELPQGYNTRIGENGRRLSGGQRQRLGIARALYRRPSILLLDEATSALDKETEKEFIEALKTWRSGLTVIVVSHRDVPLRACDTIYSVENGALKERPSI